MLKFAENFIYIMLADQSASEYNAGKAARKGINKNTYLNTF